MDADGVFARRILHRNEDGVLLLLGDDALLNEGVEDPFEFVRLLGAEHRADGSDRRADARGDLKSKGAERRRPEHAHASDADREPEREFPM